MKKRSIIITLLLTLGLISLTVGVSIAFFNYTRTGSPNTIATGRIYFHSEQNSTLNMTNIFPLTSTQASSANLDSVTVTITGDTTYVDGEEFLISLVDVNNTINNKSIPINYIATYVANTNGNIGTSSDDYYTEREDKDATIYKLNSTGEVKENTKVLVGYIDNGATGINGTLTIKAYIDADRIAISDTYDGTESDTNGTTTGWINGRTVLTTTEWNNLQGNSSISFKIRAESNEGIWVEDTIGVAKVKRAITEKINATTNSCNPIWVDNMGTANDESDDITYFSGTNACVDMNYVWYSGKLWRITAIYPDGAMKMVTENNITSIAFNESGQVNFYTDANTTSYMYQWLNEDFYDTLYHASEFIDTTKRWNATEISDSTAKPAETTMVSANVGLLNSYEYYNSYRNLGRTAYGGSFLNIRYSWRLLNSHNPSNTASNGWQVDYNGFSDGGDLSSSIGIRPSINLKSGVEFIGSGEKGNPYMIIGDKDMGKTNDSINTRISGEYIKLVNNENEQVFRIIGVEDNKTKIIAMDYADNKATRKYATGTGTADTLWGSGTTTDTDTWYTYLNNTYYPNLVSIYGNLFDSGLYYLGTSGKNYKLSVCANTTSGNTKTCDKTVQIGTFDIGLPRYGEMFAAQQAGGTSNSISVRLMNSYSMSYVWYVSNGNICTDISPTTTTGARPTLHLKSTVKILSGSGTETDPYVVGL